MEAPAGRCRLFGFLGLTVCRSAPVAQLDRAPDYESGGQRFESFRARQPSQPISHRYAQSVRVSGPAAPHFAFPRSNLRARGSGATVSEYGLLTDLISVVIIGAVKAVGTNMNSKFNTIANNLSYNRVSRRCVRAKVITER